MDAGHWGGSGGVPARSRRATDGMLEPRWKAVGCREGSGRNQLGRLLVVWSGCRWRRRIVTHGPERRQAFLRTFGKAASWLDSAFVTGTLRYGEGLRWTVHG